MEKNKTRSQGLASDGKCIYCREEVDRSKEGAVSFPCQHLVHLKCFREESAFIGTCLICATADYMEHRTDRYVSGLADGSAYPGFVGTAFRDFREEVSRDSESVFTTARILDSGTAGGNGSAGERPDIMTIPIQLTTGEAMFGSKTNEMLRLMVMETSGVAEMQAIDRFIEYVDSRKSEDRKIDPELLVREGFDFHVAKTYMMDKYYKLDFLVWRNNLGMTATDLIKMGAKWGDLLDCGLRRENYRELFPYGVPDGFVRFASVLRDLCQNNWDSFREMRLSSSEMIKLGATSSELERLPSLDGFKCFRADPVNSYPITLQVFVSDLGFDVATIERLYKKSSNQSKMSLERFMYCFCILLMKWCKKDCFNFLGLDFQEQ